jgi:hypothetical protein
MIWGEKMETNKNTDINRDLKQMNPNQESYENLSDRRSKPPVGRPPKKFNIFNIIIIIFLINFLFNFLFSNRIETDMQNSPVEWLHNTV